MNNPMPQAPVFRFLCACCARTVYMCRCYTSAETFGWPMRPEWQEARRLAASMTEDQRREAQRAHRRAGILP